MKSLFSIAALLMSSLTVLTSQILPETTIYDKGNIEMASISPKVENGYINIGVQNIGKKAIAYRYIWGTDEVKTRTSVDSFRTVKLVNGKPEYGDLQISKNKYVNIDRYLCEYIFDGEFVYVALIKNKSTLEQGRYTIADEVSSKDTVITFDPTTFEEEIILVDVYSLIKDGDWKEYNTKENAFETGRYKNGNRVGKWTQTIYKKGGMTLSKKFILEYNNGQLVTRKEKVRKQKK